jgi:hypothetical protein
MNLASPLWPVILYVVVCCTAWNRRLRWLAAFSLFLISCWIMLWQYFAIVIGFWVGGGIDIREFITAPMMVYLLLASVFILLNNIIAKTAILVLANLVLLAYLLYPVPDTLLEQDIGRHWLAEFLILAVPIWMLGFRLWPTKPRKVSAAVGDGVAAGR